MNSATIRYVQSGTLWVPETRGLGDRISSWAKRLGIRECKGCSKRRAQLNRWFPGKPMKMGAPPILGLGMPTQAGNISAQGLAGTVNTGGGVQTVCPAGAIFCEDFENWNPVTKNGWGWNAGWDPDTQGDVKCGATLTATGTEAAEGSCAIHLNFQQDAADAIFPDHSWTAQTEVYQRWYVKYSSNYQWNIPGSKAGYVRALTSGNFCWGAEIRTEPSNGVNGVGKWQQDVGAGHTDIRECNQGPASACQIQQGIWHYLEIYVKKQSDPGIADGLFKMWVAPIGEPPVLIMDYNNFGWCIEKPGGPGGCGCPNLSQTWLSFFIGGPTDTHPSQDIWVDAIAVHNSYIGR